MGRERQRGQAAVEAVGVAVALAFAALAGWQVVVAAYTWQAAQGAARTAARAGSVGAPVERAALTVLPDRLARRATVSVQDGVDGVRVRVRLRVPRIVPGAGDFGTVEGAAGVSR